MVPGKLSTMVKLASPRRYLDADYLRRFGGEIYGGTYRKRGLLESRALYA